jgi:hypothetical protein
MYTTTNYEKKVWTVMVNNSTNNKTKNHLSLPIEHTRAHPILKKNHQDIWCWKFRALLETGTQLVRAKPINVIPIVPTLDNWTPVVLQSEFYGSTVYMNMALPQYRVILNSLSLKSAKIVNFCYHKNYQIWLMP